MRAKQLIESAVEPNRQALSPASLSSDAMGLWRAALGTTYLAEKYVQRLIQELGVTVAQANHLFQSSLTHRFILAQPGGLASMSAGELFQAVQEFAARHRDTMLDLADKLDVSDSG